MYSKSQSKQPLSEAHFNQPFYINKIQRLLNLNVESVGFCPSGAWTHHKDSLIVESHSQDAKSTHVGSVKPLEQQWSEKIRESRQRRDANISLSVCIRLVRLCFVSLRRCWESGVRWRQINEPVFENVRRRKQRYLCSDEGRKTQKLSPVKYWCLKNLLKLSNRVFALHWSVSLSILAFKSIRVDH